MKPLEETHPSLVCSSCNQITKILWKGDCKKCYYRKYRANNLGTMRKNANKYSLKKNALIANTGVCESCRGPCWPDCQLCKSCCKRDEKAYNWKGIEAKYAAKHMWMRNNFGAASKCELFGCTAKVYHWANCSGKYLRKREDYVMLCPKCHSFCDRRKINPKELILIKEKHTIDKAVLRKAILYAKQYEGLNGVDWEELLVEKLGLEKIE